MARNIFIAILGILFAFFAWGSLFAMLPNQPSHPTLPTKSEPKTVVLTSKGCCFLATDVTVNIIDGQQNSIPLLCQEAVYEHDIFVCDEIPLLEGPCTVEIAFTSHYVVEEPVVLCLGTFSSATEVRDKGMLLCFGDGTLCMDMAGESTEFVAGCFGGGERRLVFGNRNRALIGCDPAPSLID